MIPFESDSSAGKSGGDSERRVADSEEEGFTT